MEAKTPAELEHNILVWQAPNRPFKKRNIRFYFNVAVIGIVIGLVLLFFYQYSLIAVLFAFAFVGIVLNTVPPHDIDYKFTNLGIRIEDTLYRWEDLTEFWPATIYKDPVFFITTSLKFPRQLTLMLDMAHYDAIKKILHEKLEEVEQPKETWLDRRANDLVKLVNLGQKDR